MFLLEELAKQSTRSKEGISWQPFGRHSFGPWRDGWHKRCFLRVLSVILRLIIISDPTEKFIRRNGEETERGRIT